MNTEGKDWFETISENLDGPGTLLPGHPPPATPEKKDKRHTQSVADAQRALRDEEVTRLRADGHTRKEIAEITGVSTNHSWRIEKRQMKKMAKQIESNIDRIRAAESIKLDILGMQAFDMALDEELSVPDRLRAHEVLLKNRARHAALLGLDLKQDMVATGPVFVVNATPPWERDVEGEAVVREIGDGGETP